MTPTLRRHFFIPALLAVFCLAPSTPAQDPAPLPAAPAAVTPEEREAVVARIGALLEERYVFPEVARRCAEHLQAELAAGAFDDASDPAAFAERLTEAVQSVSRDKHMRVRVRPAEQRREEAANPARARDAQLERMARENFGFERVERREGNIGYLDLRYFAGTPRARGTAAAAMSFLAHADAIIFDMRRNGGGSPEMIRFLCSYLFDEPTHLNSLYWREGDVTEEFWTLPEVPGPRRPDVPVFVLTSDYTFSGAEEFTYNLQTRGRGTVVGETTGGGANPGGMMPAGERFGIFVPTGRAINPVTGTNWEGVGVRPDVEVPAEEALDEALELAAAAAAAHREQRARQREELWSSMERARVAAYELDGAGRREEARRVLTAALERAVAADLLGEMAINQLGYDMLGEDRVKLAITVFAFNVERYPESANVYDSLAESYMRDGQDDLAIEHYRKSLELDPQNRNAEAMIERIRSGG